MSLRVAVAGATGRMGQSIARAAAQSEDLTLSHLGTYSGSSAEGRSVAELLGIAIENVEIVTDPASLAEADVVIDFTLPEATLGNAAACVARGTPMVIGTTGFSSDQLERLDAIAQEIPVCRAANFSTGVTLAYRLIALAAEVMGVGTDVEIAETHHRHKVDAPSGTALAMGEVIAGVRGVPLDAIADYDRSSRREPRRAGSLGFSVSRLGDVVGDHTVSFGSDSERLEITHKASSRDAFALGALKAARWLVTKPSGCYDMNDVLGLAGSGHE